MSRRSPAGFRNTNTKATIKVNKIQVELCSSPVAL